MNELALRIDSLAAETLKETMTAAVELLKNQRSERTEKVYAANWTRFESWCDGYNQTPLPAEEGTVALFIAALCQRELKPSTIELSLSAISQRHQDKGEELKTKQARQVLKGYKRQVGTEQKRAEPLTVEMLRRCLDTIPATTKGARDRALLLVGWCCALRSSELVGLQWDDVRQVDSGLVVSIRKSKTDQTGEGAELAVPFADNADYCPVAAVNAWKDIQGGGGCMFPSIDRHGNVKEKHLHPISVGELLKQILKAAGYNSTGYSGHSLRAGLATSAAQADKPTFTIQNQTRHKSLKMLHLYVRAGNMFSEKENCLHGLL